MKHKAKRLSSWMRLSILGILLVGVCFAAYSVFASGRPAPLPVKHELFEGVIYRRVVRYLPRFMIAHVLVIDTNAKGLGFFVTPPDNVEGGPLKARTTTQFLEEFGVQLAINGDGFFPWWSRSPIDYYPHAGDPVTPNGYAASRGEVYALGLEDITAEPTMYISRLNAITFNKKPGRVMNAISGDRMLIVGGEPMPDLDDSELDPRTAVGINRNGRWLYIVVVDGRQPFYSEGATLMELAELLEGFGAFHAMSLDGGGSSTMVMEQADGRPVILNSPIDHYIPGRERPVANHLGIYIK